MFRLSGAAEDSAFEPGIWLGLFDVDCQKPPTTCFLHHAKPSTAKRPKLERRLGRATLESSVGVLAEDGGFPVSHVFFCRS